MGTGTCALPTTARGLPRAIETAASRPPQGEAISSRPERFQMLRFSDLVFCRRHTCNEANAAEAAAVVKLRDHGVEFLVCLIGAFTMNAGIGRAVLPPGAEALGGIRRPVAREVRRGDLHETR